MRRALNEGMRDEWEFQQYEREETLELFGPFKPIWDPRMLVFAEVDGALAGVAVGWPDWTPLFRSLHGRAGPIATLKVLRNWRKMERAGLQGIAVLPEFRGRGIGAALLARFFAGLEEMGFSGSLYFYVNEENRRSRRLAESFGGDGRVLYHCYDKPLG